jgi:WD40 repeat protein/serine/threonine protein kinase
MNPDEELLDWQAADQALAAGAAADTPLETRLERDLAFLHRVRRALSPPAPATPLLNVGVADGALSTVGRFQVRRELGRGAFGVVFLAHDPLLGREVALKVPRAEILVTPELRERFHREARTAAGLDHPNLVPVYEAGEAGPICFLVSAYCPGPTLARWLRQRTEPVPFDTAARLVATLAEAVEYAHRHGVVHRDLKPSNILLQNDELGVMNDELRKEPPSSTSSFILHPSSFIIPKITDFGLAKLLDGTPGSDTSGYPTRSGAIVGTVGYMAPEQAGGKTRDIGPAADTYALGAILYEVLTGRPPFRGETELDTLQQLREEEPVPPTRLRPKLPRDLETICLQCLRKEPSRRYDRTAALAEDLRHFLAGEPIRARQVSLWERAWRWCRRNPSLATVSGLAGIALVTVVALAFGLAYVQSNAATQTKAALDHAEKQYVLAERRSALMALEQGLNLCEQGKVGHGMLWLARSLEIVDRLPAPGDADLQRVLRANLAYRRRDLPTLRALFHVPEGVQYRAVDFSPDGKTLLMASRDGTASLWNVATGQPAGPSFPHPGGVLAVAFRADGRCVATGGKDQTARLWEVATGQPLGLPLPHQGEVRAVAFSPDGKALLTGSADHRAQLWDVATGRPLGPPLLHQGAVQSVDFSLNGELLLTGSTDRMARLWETATGKPVGSPLEHDAEVHAVALNPDGQTLLTGANRAELWDADLRQWSGRLGRRLLPLPHPRTVDDVDFSPDGRIALTGGNDGTARLWNLAVADRRPQFLSPLQFQNPVSAVAFSPDGRTFLTGVINEPARLWEMASLAPRELVRHQGVVKDVAFSRDGRLILTVSNDKTAQVWGAATGKPFGSRLTHPDRVLNGVFSPDGRTVLTGCADKIARLWETATGNLLGRALRHEHQVNAVAFSADGRTVLTGAGKEVRFWEAVTGQAIEPVLRHEDTIEAVAFSPDGRTVLSGSADQTARQWDAVTGQPCGPPLRHHGRVTSVAYSADGRTILTGSTDLTAQLWDAATGKALGLALLHSAAVEAVAFSPDGRTLLTGSNSRAYLWDAITSKSIGTSYFLHNDLISAVTFSPDGRWVLTGSYDRRVLLWELPAPVDGPVERIVLWVQVVCGMEMDEENVIHVLDAPTWHQRRQRLQKLGGSLD